MHKQDLDSSLSGLSRERLASILKDLAADPANKERIAAAAELPKVCQNVPLERSMKVLTSMC